MNTFMICNKSLHSKGFGDLPLEMIRRESWGRADLALKRQEKWESQGSCYSAKRTEMSWAELGTGSCPEFSVR